MGKTLQGKRRQYPGGKITECANVGAFGLRHRHFPISSTLAVPNLSLLYSISKKKLRLRTLHDEIHEDGGTLLQEWRRKLVLDGAKLRGRATPPFKLSYDDKAHTMSTSVLV